MDVAREVAYLAGAQNPDGGFGARAGQASSELYTAWAAIGLAAAGRDPLSLRRDGHTVLDALRGEASSLQGAGDLERTILALRACGASVHSLPGGDPVARLLGFRDSDGSFGASQQPDRVRASSRCAPPATRRATRSCAPPRAGWRASRKPTAASASPSAAAAATSTTPPPSCRPSRRPACARGAVRRARASAFLVRAQNLDGGYPQQPGGQSNAQSTAWAVQGLIAAGRDPATITRAGSRSPLGYLESLLAAERKRALLAHRLADPVWVTARGASSRACPAASPFPARARLACRGPTGR